MSASARYERSGPLNTGISYVRSVRLASESESVLHARCSLGGGLLNLDYGSGSHSMTGVCPNFDYHHNDVRREQSDWLALLLYGLYEITARRTSSPAAQVPADTQDKLPPNSIARLLIIFEERKVVTAVAFRPKISAQAPTFVLAETSGVSDKVENHLRAAGSHTHSSPEINLATSVPMDSPEDEKRETVAVL